MIANISEEVMEKIVAPVEKKTAAKKPAAKKPAAKKATVKKVEKDGFERVEVGTEMPYYLL